MKKWIALLLSAVLMLSLLAGCGGGKETPTTPDAPNTPSDPSTPNTPAAPETPVDDGKPEGVADEQVVKILYTCAIYDWKPQHSSGGATR